jgi:hypothetical protein
MGEILALALLKTPSPLVRLVPSGLAGALRIHPAVPMRYETTRILDSNSTKPKYIHLSVSICAPSLRIIPSGQAIIVNSCQFAGEAENAN